MPRAVPTGRLLDQADLQLLEREFTIEDPTSIPDLAQSLPVGGPVPAIIFKYDTKASGRPKLRCAHCRGARHWKGYVVELSTGQLALIAERQCGRDAFGFKWDTVEAQFKADRDRQLDLQRLVLVEPLLDPLIAELRSTDLAESLRGHERYLTDLRTRFGRFGQALAKMARQGGQLETTQWLRNRAREEDAVRRLRPDLIDDVERALEVGARQRARKALDRFIEDNCEVKEPAPLILGQCRGWRTFVSGPGPQALFNEAFTSLVSTRSALGAGGAPAKLGQMLKAVASACEDVSYALAIVGELERFVAPDNLEEIAKWVSMDGSLRFAFRADGRALVDGLSGNVLGPDPAWKVPRLPTLAQMKSALGISA